MPEVCNCEEAQALRAELTIVKAQRDYLVQFADPKELMAMERDLAAEHGELASGETG